MSTVEDVWRLALPHGSTLVAGAGGLWREVRASTRLRPRPPGFDDLQGGELAFISLQTMRLLDENLTLSTVLGQLGEMKVAAVAVVGDFADDAHATAERLSLPLFLLPGGTNVAEAEQFAMRVIVERQADLYRRSQEVYRQLTELAIEGRGLPAIVERLAQLAGKPAAMQDESGEMRLFSAPRDSWLTRQEALALLADNQAELERWLRGAPPSASDPPVTQIRLGREGLSRLVAPVAGRLGVAGVISLFGEPSRLGEVERLAVGRGAAACAIELARRQAAIDAQDELQIGVVDELLMGSANEMEAVHERALRLGYDLHQPHAVIVFQLPEIRGMPETIDLPRAVEREIGRWRVRAPLRPRGQSVTVLFPLESPLADLALKKLAEDIRAAVATRLRRPDLSAGLGRLHLGLEGLRQAHDEAEQALALGLLVIGTGKVVFFGDLGLYRMLFSITEKDELRAFHDEMLGKLIAYDDHNRAELIPTLAAYFASRNSPTEAAERMHLHRNTFLYRLNRIREITGLDLDDAETRLALHLALRVGDTLQAQSGSRRDSDPTPHRIAARRGRPPGRATSRGERLRLV